MMSTPSYHETVEPFDFDEWMSLAHRDPEEFERRRLAAIENLIRNLPPARQQRLRGLQFRIDMERRRARTPMGACIKLSSMMWDALLGAHGLRASLSRLQSSDTQTSIPQKRSVAQVLPFQKN